ncbi:zinc finger, CCHC-type containing protein [Tanacetum coccineum]
MASRDVAFWKEAVQSEIDSIMHNDTWELTDLPLGCKALGCKWILKRKMKVDGSIDKYKARLVIQGLDNRRELTSFDTYAHVEEFTSKQPEGFVVPGHESKADMILLVGKLSRYTSNPSALHWQALSRVFQYLKGTMDYGLNYSGYPFVIEGYSAASWINNMEDHSSTSGFFEEVLFLGLSKRIPVLYYKSTMDV